MIKKFFDRSKCNSKHSNANIFCVRCSIPVCPKCIVHSPVGVRCISCGKSSLSVLNKMSIGLFLKTLFISVFSGLLIGYVLLIMSDIYLYWIHWIGVLFAAYAISEIVYKISEYKRGFKVQLIGSLGLGVCICVQLFFSGYFSVFTLIVGGISFYLIMLKLR
ncbi:MAG: hypothetical protein CL770_05450 [Chloroflexi bacterium]|nr:hypothetical protein [Chloroflexota bacterium]|tara:strand:- start:29627 stop:30112 length:486 start_codon:yes stop_codon:yes gene_type:complete